MRDRWAPYLVPSNLGTLTFEMLIFETSVVSLYNFHSPSTDEPSNQQLWSVKARTPQEGVLWYVMRELGNRKYQCHKGVSLVCNNVCNIHMNTRTKEPASTNLHSGSIYSPPGSFSFIALLSSSDGPISIVGTFDSEKNKKERGLLTTIQDLVQQHTGPTIKLHLKFSSLRDRRKTSSTKY